MFERTVHQNRSQQSCNPQTKCRKGRTSQLQELPKRQRKIYIEVNRETDKDRGRRKEKVSEINIKNRISERETDTKKDK